MIPYNKRQDAQIVKIKDYINGKREYVTGEGTSLTLENTANNPFNKIILKGNTTQTQYTGKNMLNVSKISTGTKNGITLSYDKDTQIFTINGTCTTDNTLFELYDTYQIHDKTTKFIAYYISGSVNVYAVFRLFQQDFSSIISLNLTNLSNTNKSIMQIAPTDFVAHSGQNSLRIENGTTADNFKFKLMLTDSDDTEWEPYCGGIPSPNPDYPQDINVVSGSNVISTSNKNLFNAQIQAGTYNGAIYSVARDGLITQSASDNSGWDKGQTRNFYLDAGTYTINCVGKGTDKILQVRNLTDNVDIIKTQYEKETFTLTERKLLGIKTHGSSRYPASYYVQIEKGSEATTYEPHQGKELPLDLGNIELCKIGDYQDYFKKENGKWYKVENIGSYTFKGNEDFHFADVGTIKQRFDIQTSALNITTQNNLEYKLFTHFKQIPNNNGVWGEYYMSSTWIVIKDNDNIMTSLEDFKAWLSANKPTIYYARISPIDIEITDTTLITQLDALEQAVSYDDTTNISQTNANLPFIINAEAVKKLL